MSKMSFAISPHRHNTAILAAAGSRKTECVVEAALAVAGGSVLITTYTDENQRHIVRRIEQKVGIVPKHITVMGWFSFLITQCVKPYQRATSLVVVEIRIFGIHAEKNVFFKSPLSNDLESTKA